MPMIDFSTMTDRELIAMTTSGLNEVAKRGRKVWDLLEADVGLSEQSDEIDEWLAFLGNAD